MLLSRGGALEAGLACILLATCAPQDSPPDAGADASVDAGRDAQRPDAWRAPRDVGTDARTDASRDGGPDDPVWMRLGGQPDGCVISRAEHPERVVQLAWEACGEGCQRAVPEPPGAALAGYVDGDHRYALLGIAATAESPELRAMIEIDGPTLGAWQHRDDVSPSCHVLPFGVGESRAGFASWAEADVTTDEITVSFWLTAIDEIGDASEPVYQFNGPTDVPTHLFVSATNYAYRMSSGQLVLLDDANESTLMNGRDFRGIPQNEDLRGEVLFFETNGGGVSRLAVGTVADGPTYLRNIAPGEIRHFHTDGSTFAWLQGTEFDAFTLTYGTLELWSAPYVTSAADLTPRRIRDFPGLYRGEIGGRWYAAESNLADGGMDVYDLTDGTRRHWVPPPATGTRGAPLYVTDEEILLQANGAEAGVYRIDPRTLPIVP